MDCGDPKAYCEQLTLDYISYQINHKYVLKDAFGSITFQVLVDSTGFSCVLSHTDITKSSLTTDIIRYLNGVLWRPAREKGKRVSASVNVLFTFSNGGISAKMQRVDLTQAAPAGDPLVFNTFNYINPSLKNYDFKVWTKYNSPIPDNVSKVAIVDKSDLLWYASGSGLTRFGGDQFDPVTEYNSPFNSQTVVQDIIADNDNNKWVYADNKMYRYNDAGWQIFDFKRFLGAGVNKILSSRHGELLFATKAGLVVLRKEKVVLLNKKSIPLLPSNDVKFAFDDSRQRLWIGTANGCIMMDHGVVTTFSTSNTPLKNATISGATEDEHGNIYFSLVDYNNIPGVDSPLEGIAVLKANGTWTHYIDRNSGMPSNHVNTMLYDKFEHVLWLGTEQSGLVRFDLKEGWENYNNHNSPAPGFIIYKLMQDSKGLIYATTANGLLRISKK